MEKQVKAPQMIRQRKFMLLLPLLVLPFMTLMFWSLGGGRINRAAAESAEQTGFNVLLPDAALKEENWPDKMSYYDRAKSDSLKFQELINNDPNYRNLDVSDSARIIKSNKVKPPVISSATGLNKSLYAGGSNDPNADKIYRKLDELERQMKKPTEINYEKSAVSTGSHAVKAENLINTGDINRLEQMMHTMSQSDGEDPEMQQLNGMLEKILEIQHPGRVEKELKQTTTSNRGQILPVSARGRENVISLMQADMEASAPNGFYSMDGNVIKNINQNTLQAVIHETQTIVNGAAVKMRLKSDIYIGDVLIPKDNFLFGTASIGGDRLAIKIKSIRYDNALFPVDLSVYDLDGLEGISIPEAISRDVAKQSADRSMQTIGLVSADPSWGAQAMGAGITAAKSLFSKKVKLVKVNVKAGYQVFLKDEKQKQTL